MRHLKSPTVIDLFAGAGGFGLGFRAAGYSLGCSVEIDQWAADTLRHNHPHHRVVEEDITRISTASEIRALCPDPPTVIIGGPPCQGFSIAGPAKKDPADPRNSLFREFARWVSVLSPQAFVMENVKGLLARRTATGEGVIDIIASTFAAAGYFVEVWVLNSAEYGVPQIRERVFIVGNRYGRPLGPPPKTHSLSTPIAPRDQPELFPISPLLPSALTLWDAISDLPQILPGQGHEEQPYTTNFSTPYQEWARGLQSVLYNHVAMQHSSRLVERFKHVQWGDSGADVPDHHRAHRRNGNGALSSSTYDQNNRRLHPHKPSHTIAAAFYANFIHPYQHRNLTAREGARIQSFPDHYRFMGKKTVVSQRLLTREGRIAEKHLCQYNQIGNAIPPLLANAIALHLKEVII